MATEGQRRRDCSDQYERLLDHEPGFYERDGGRPYVNVVEGKVAGLDNGLKEREEPKIKPNLCSCLTRSCYQWIWEGCKERRA